MEGGGGCFAFCLFCCGVGFFVVVVVVVGFVCFLFSFFFLGGGEGGGLFCPFLKRSFILVNFQECSSAARRSGICHNSFILSRVSKYTLHPVGIKMATNSWL